MTIFVNFHSTNHLFKCDIMISLQWKMRSNSQGFSMLHIFKNISLGLWVYEQAEHLCVSIEHLLSAIEYMLMPLSDCEQPHTTHWVRMNVIEWVWTPIECAWMPLSYYWMWLTMVWSWETTPLCENETAPEHNWVHIHAFEWLWTLNTHWVCKNTFE